MKKTFLVLISALLAVSCGNTNNEYAKEYAADEKFVAEAEMAAGGEMLMSRQNAPMMDGSAVAEPVEVAVPAEAVAKKIIKDGRMGIKVRDIKAGKASIDALVKKYQAYYGSEEYNDYGYSVAYDLVIRIPAKSFEGLVADIEAGAGEVSYKNIDSRDVTEQFYDLQTRLENKRSYLARYRDLLKRANTIKEILEVETYIRALEEEIESAEGRLRLLNSQVDYSTLTLNVSQDKELASGPSDSFWYRMKDALSAGWSGFVSFVVAVFYVWPLWLILGGVAWLICYLVRRRKMKNK